MVQENEALHSKEEVKHTKEAHSTFLKNSEYPLLKHAEHQLKDGNVLVGGYPV